MSFTGNYVCTQFKKQLLEGKHDFTLGTGHTFKLALYDSNATLNADTTDYSTDNEITGTGYTAGGATLTVVSPVSGSGKAWADFADLTFSSATFTARGGLIYNTTTGGSVATTDAVLVLDFGMDRTKSAEDFVVIFPTADALNAIVKIS